MTRPRDAIIGARYMDTVFDSEFTIVRIEARTDADEAEAEDIIVIADYDEFEDEVEITLPAFRKDSSISVVEIPEHAG